MLIDGVSYDINWKNFKTGTSIFIPCLDCIAAKAYILKTTRRLKVPVLIKISIEEGIRGLRIWKI